MGRPLPRIVNWVATYTNKQALPSASKFHHYKNDDGDHQEDEKKAGVKAGAENVSDQFAAG